MGMQMWKPKESRKQFEFTFKTGNHTMANPNMNLRLQKIQTGE